MYWSNWLRGDIVQCDISDPSSPKISGRMWLGGVARRGGAVKVLGGLPDGLAELPELPQVGLELGDAVHPSAMIEIPRMLGNRNCLHVGERVWVGGVQASRGRARLMPWQISLLVESLHACLVCSTCSNSPLTFVLHSQCQLVLSELQCHPVPGLQVPR